MVGSMTAGCGRGLQSNGKVIAMLYMCFALLHRSCLPTLWLISARRSWTLKALRRRPAAPG